MRAVAFLKTKINLLAMVLCTSLAGLWMILVAKSYYYFIYGTEWDPAYHAQNIWALLHGSMCPSILGANFITNHCTFLCFLVAPLYWLSPDPMLLQYLKIVGFFAGSYVFFLMLKKNLHPFIALGVMMAFVLAPANVSMLYGIFNYEAFSIPLVFLIFKANEENNFLLFISCCFLLALVKEQMPLLIAMFGLFTLLFKKENKIKWAVIPIVMGLVIFAIEVFILTPYVRQDLPHTQSFHWERYMQFGKTPPQIISFLLTHPWAILKQCVSPQIITWYNGLFGVWGVLAFLSPHILFVALPLFLKTILSSNYHEHDLVVPSWYASTFTPFIFLAAWNTLNHIQNKWRRPIHAIALAIMLVHAFIFIPLRLAILNPSITNNAIARQNLIDQIPSSASVLSSWKTLAPLSNRQELYPVFSYLKGAYYVSERKFALPGHTDYLLLDFAQDGTVNSDRKKYIPKMAALNFDNRWRLQESIEDIALYVKNPSRQKADRLMERSNQPFVQKNNYSRTFENTIRLTDVEFLKEFPQKYRIFPVTMYWQCLQKTDIPYEILINIASVDKKNYYTKLRTIGSTIYPANFWKQGEYIKESYFYLLPPMPQGNFDIKISIFNPVSKKWIGINAENFSIQ